MPRAPVPVNRKGGLHNYDQRHASRVHTLCCRFDVPMLRTTTMIVDISCPGGLGLLSVVGPLVIVETSRADKRPQREFLKYWNITGRSILQSTETRVTLFVLRAPDSVKRLLSTPKIVASFKLKQPRNLSVRTAI